MSNSAKPNALIGAANLRRRQCWVPRRGEPRSRTATGEAKKPPKSPQNRRFNIWPQSRKCCWIRNEGRGLGRLRIGKAAISKRIQSCDAEEGSENLGGILRSQKSSGRRMSGHRSEAGKSRGNVIPNFGQRFRVWAADEASRADTAGLIQSTVLWNPIFDKIPDRSAPEWENRQLSGKPNFAAPKIFTGISQRRTDPNRRSLCTRTQKSQSQFQEAVAVRNGHSAAKRWLWPSRPVYTLFDGIWRPIPGRSALKSKTNAANSR